jgi:hypothetical protein
MKIGIRWLTVANMMEYEILSAIQPKDARMEQMHQTAMHVESILAMHSGSAFVKIIFQEMTAKRTMVFETSYVIAAMVLRRLIALNVSRMHIKLMGSVFVKITGQGTLALNIKAPAMLYAMDAPVLLFLTVISVLITQEKSTPFVNAIRTTLALTVRITAVAVLTNAVHVPPQLNQTALNE